MSTVAVPAPVPTHLIRKAVIFTAALTITSGGVYAGTTALVAHANAPHASVSYASPDVIARTLSGAVHTPAKQGAFLDGADISTPDVVSVVKAVR